MTNKSNLHLHPRKALNGVVSIVIPAYNEEGNIGRTIEGLLAEEQKSLYKFEIIAVDDGSKDGTWSVIQKFAADHQNVVGINQLGNFGQSQAYQAGFDNATGDYVLLCSADMETPLSYIHKIIERLDQGYDFVNTNRLGRWGGERAVKSGLANKLIRKVSGIEIMDRGSGMKGMISPIARNMNLYGEMHRFLPDYASVYGAKITEFETEFKDREFGVSAYTGHKRTIKVLLDLMTLYFMLKFAKKPFTAMPGRMFGFTGGIMFIFGFGISFTLVTEKIIFGATLGDRPLFTLGIFMALLGFIMMMFGMLGELLLRVYFESSGRRPYMSRSIVNSKR
ncbi:MAG: glycosyltransferase family 2 protein [Niabella sp.]|nr:MAG: glycosyltransferase family 2 protein [Niabella sp.]